MENNNENQISENIQVQPSEITNNDKDNIQPENHNLDSEVQGKTINLEENNSQSQVSNLESQEKKSKSDVFKQNEIEKNTDIYEELGFEKGPYAPSGWPIVSKVITGLVVGFLISFLVFMVIFMLGTDTFTNDSVSFLPFILLLVAFVSTFIGNSMIMGAYNLFFSDRYYDFGKMFGMVLLTNAILFFLFIFVYLMGDVQNNSIMVILAFHIFLSIFISYNIIEFLPNPQYSTSSFTGNIIGFTVVIVIYLIVFNTTQLSSDSMKMYNLMLWPCILGYTIIPLAQGLWQNIYRWFYEKGNNFFYLPTEQERLEESVYSEEEIIKKEEVNVEDK